MLGLDKLKSKCFQTSYLHPSADVASLISVEIHSHAQLKKSVSLIAEFANNCAQTRLVQRPNCRFIEFWRKFEIAKIQYFCKHDFDFPEFPTHKEIFGLSRLKIVQIVSAFGGSLQGIGSDGPNQSTRNGRNPTTSPKLSKTMRRAGLAQDTGN